MLWLMEDCYMAAFCLVFQVPILEILGIFALKLMMVSFSQTVNVVKAGQSIFPLFFFWTATETW